MLDDLDFGVVFKATDLNTGRFYIGETTVKEKWDSGYMGSGKKWTEWYLSHPNHEYIVEPLHYENESLDNLYNKEVEEIRTYAELINGKWVIMILFV